MKKFYAFALAAALGFTASAATRQQATQAPVLRTAAVSTTAKTIDGAKLKLPAKSAPAKAASLAEDGKYIWAFYSLKGNDDPDQLQATNIQITLDGNDATISGMFVMSSTVSYDVKATVDLEKGTLTIPQQLLFSDSDGPVYLYAKTVDPETGALNNGVAAPALTGTFTSEGIFFNQYDIFAAGDPAQEDLGWYVLSYSNMFIDPAALPQEVLYGKAVFTERVFSPLFRGSNGSAMEIAPYEVDVTYYEDEPNTLIIKDAAKGFYTANGWGMYESPEWTLDITDRSNIVMPLASLDFGPTQGVLYYVGSMSYYYQEAAGTTTPDAEKIYMKEEGNTVTITFPEESTFIMDTQNMQPEYASPAVSTLVITRESGVEGVAAENAPVEYFNLQGVKVQNPEAGLYIRRQGNTATKVLFK
ncbi:MAG: hypothetical protein K2M55_04745 [Muribaculaceae bacterium]|nr:hypothetical protein [Muribaculaceae bacterium]